MSMDKRYQLAIRLNPHISLELDKMINDNMPYEHILYAMIHYHQRYDIKNDDLIVCRMVSILYQNDFVLSKEYLLKLHKLLYVDDISYFPGKLRNKDISLRSHYLNDKRVFFSSYLYISDYLDYDFDEEINRISKEKVDNIAALSNFMVKLFNIHPFVKGNICCIIVFLLKYLDANYVKYDINYLISNFDSFYKGLVIACDNETGFSDDRMIMDFMEGFVG